MERQGEKKETRKGILNGTDGGGEGGEYDRDMEGEVRTGDNSCNKRGKRGDHEQGPRGEGEKRKREMMKGGRQREKRTEDSWGRERVRWKRGKRKEGGREMGREK